MTTKYRAPLLEVSHVARRLGYDSPYIRQLIHQGKLRAVRIGTRFRVDEVDLEAFINARRTAPARRQTDARELRESA
jgi:excisionase family DNA binding protein